jgi:2,3-bisphosphoglycerate-independent phosphoglycerate mutase
LEDCVVNNRRLKHNKKPANMVLLRGAGQVVKMPSFYKKHRLKAVCIAGAGLYKGIARAIGMDVYEVPGATGMPDTALDAKVQSAIKLFKKYDFVFLHIKGTDILAEDGDYIGKKKFIEKIDKALKPLLSRRENLIILTADHTTSSYLKIHTADPVPVLMTGKNIYTDSITSFSEANAYNGKLGHIQGKHLMPIIKDYLGRAPLFGA